MVNITTLCSEPLCSDLTVVNITTLCSEPLSSDLTVVKITKFVSEPLARCSEFSGSENH